MRFLSCFMLMLALFVGAFPAHAQTLGPEPLTVSITPQYPRPYDTIFIRPGSTLLNLSASKVVVSVNGEVIEEGSGTRPAEYRLGGPGSAAAIRITATDSANQVYTKEITLRPADVSLVTDASSTAHPFYAGAQLVAPEGMVRLVAIPDLRTSSGAVISPDNLVYTWMHGERTLTNDSGIGRSVLTATAPVRHRDARITVTVSTQDRAIVASATTLVSPVDPVVRVYQTGPLLGPRYESAINDSFAMAGAEETFRAVPYFFRSTPAISWNVNGSGGENNRDLTVRITESGAGTARIGVTAALPGVFQRAEDMFALSFGAQSGGGIFGF